MIRAWIERLERRVLFSGSIPSGTRLAWSGGITDGVADEAISPAITLTLKDSHGNVVDVSGVKATLSLNGNGSDRVLGKAVLEHGVATLSGLLPKIAGRYRLAAVVQGLRISGRFVMEGGPGARMKLVGFGYDGFEGQQFFDVKLWDGFGNVATSDTSLLFFKVAQTDGIVQNIAFIYEAGLVDTNGTVAVRFGAETPGHAGFSIEAMGYKPIGLGGGEQATVSVILYDSNPNIRPIVSPPWTIF